MEKTVNAIFCVMALMTLVISLPACKQASPGFEVLSLDIMPPEVKIGERVTIRAELRNVRVSRQTYNVPLMVNGVAQDRKTVTLRSGTTEVVEFSLIRYRAGSYKISIGDKSAILEVQAPLPPAFQISELKITPSVANIGQKIFFTARVTNTGGMEGNYIAELKIDNCTVKKEEVIIAAGTDYILSFVVCMDAPGTYTSSLGELTGQFVVVEPVQPIPPNNTIQPPPTPGPCRTRT